METARSLGRQIPPPQTSCCHLEVEGIPEYINMLEDAQRQADRVGRTISNDTLLLFALTAMLTSERFPRENDAWEDRAEVDKTWEAWKLAYK